MIIQALYNFISRKIKFVLKKNNGLISLLKVKEVIYFLSIHVILFISCRYCYRILQWNFELNMQHVHLLIFNTAQEKKESMYCVNTAA